MTREEARIWLKTFKGRTGMHELSQAFDVAIEALEPKPMQKFDNVKQHIDRLAGDYKCWDERLSHEEALELSRMLEQEPCDDVISRHDAIDVVRKWFDKTQQNGDICLDGIRSLPSVTPQPKTGHWQVVSDGYGDNAYICECSECKDAVWVYKDADKKWNYCPNCGARMSESKYYAELSKSLAQGLRQGLHEGFSENEGKK